MRGCHALHAIAHFHALEFGLEAAKQPVPQQQGAAEIAVDVAFIRAMVHAVVRGRDHEAIEDAGFVHQRIVVIELHRVMQRRDDKEDFQRHAQHGQDGDEGEIRQRRIPGIAHAQRQVEMLALVVHHVHGPQQRDFMVQPVHPVKAQVPGKKREYPLRHHGPLVDDVQVRMAQQQGEGRHFHAAEHPHQDVAGIEIEDHVLPRHGRLAYPFEYQQFGQHEGQHDQERQGKWIHHGAVLMETARRAAKDTCIFASMPPAMPTNRPAARSMLTCRRSAMMA
ncbi:hypothetical protein D3C72_1469420 [compost metagenome]